MIRCLKQIWLLDLTKLTSQDIDTIWKYGLEPFWVNNSQEIGENRRV